SLTDVSKFGVLSGTSSDTSKLSTTVDATKASVGSYSIGVSTLAQAQKLQSAGMADITSAVGTGKLVIQFGTYNSSGNTFTANPDKASTTITIDSTNNSLAGIRDAINKAGAGVTASIVNDGTANGYHLVLSSIDTGTKNSMRIAVQGDSVGTDTDATGLSQLAYDPTATAGAGKNLTEGQAAKDAVLNIDGVTVTKSSNTITDAIQGVTLNLKDVTTTNISVNVSKDVGAIKSGIQSLVKGYNTFLQAMNSLGGYDSKTKAAGPLQGESVMRTIQNEIRNTLNTRLTGNTRTLRSLSDIGIEFQRDGTLTFNESKLNSAVNDHFDEIPGLFGAYGVSSDSNISYQSSTSSTNSGTYAVNVSTVPTQASYNGTTPGGGFTFPLTIDASNDTLQVLVDGTTSGTVSLSDGSYASGDALAA
ncbi:MAG TPA: flagellar filament capping protein FliD, partial [Pseudomonadales bacterium]|nr:flagellar filament capping protein FliD [Pseudomonadales bacterium]